MYTTADRSYWPIFVHYGILYVWCCHIFAIIMLTLSSLIALLDCVEGIFIVVYEVCSTLLSLKIVYLVYFIISNFSIWSHSHKRIVYIFVAFTSNLIYGCCLAACVCDYKYKHTHKNRNLTSGTCNVIYNDYMVFVVLCSLRMCLAVQEL